MPALDDSAVLAHIAKLPHARATYKQLVKELRANGHDRDRLEDTLDRLTDCKLAVLTNKPVHFSCAMLDGLGIYKHFAAVYGGNSFDHKKPDPVGVYQILSDTKGQRERTWMIGDSAVDVLTGRNAGTKTCGVTYGYATDTFKDAPPDFLIDNFCDLEALVHD